MKKKLRKILMIFDRENLKVKLRHFLTPPHYTNSQNSIIAFGYVDSQAKIFLILYPCLKNSTTRNAIAWSVYIIICMTVNRYISIYMPTYFQRIHTFKNAYVAIFFSFLGGVLLHVPLSFEEVVVTCDDQIIPPVSPVTPSTIG